METDLADLFREHSSIQERALTRWVSFSGSLGNSGSTRFRPARTAVLAATGPDGGTPRRRHAQTTASPDDSKPRRQQAQTTASPDDSKPRRQQAQTANAEYADTAHAEGRRTCVFGSSGREGARAPLAVPAVPAFSACRVSVPSVRRLGSRRCFQIRASALRAPATTPRRTCPLQIVDVSAAMLYRRDLFVQIGHIGVSRICDHFHSRRSRRQRQPLDSAARIAEHPSTDSRMHAEQVGSCPPQIGLLSQFQESRSSRSTRDLDAPATTYKPVTPN